MNKKKAINDPFAGREAQKYENPIPSREFLLDLLKKADKPQSYRQLAVELDLEGNQKEALRRRLKAMERDGQLLRTNKGAYNIIKNMGLVRGRFQSHREGYGFVIPHDGSEDVYLNSRESRAVFNDDEVLVRIVGADPRGKRDGVIVEVLERNTEQMVGRYFSEKQMGVVEPAGKRIKKDILVAHENNMKATSGQFVMVEIIQQPTKHTQAIGKITEILGDHMAPGMEIDVAIRSYQLPHKWSDALLDEVHKIPDEVQEEDLKGHKDLRDLAFVTIDGEDARDFDDAVYCEPNKKGWRLYVAIADVSHYVKPGMALDQEAYIRGNSVYFPERVIPMLPEKLSNGLCSLNPNVDRLCMVADMTLDKEGKLIRTNFYPGVIHSQARLTYTKVADFLENSEQPFDKKINQHISNLHELYLTLRQSRDKRGAIDLDTTETQIVFGENKKIDKIVPVVRNVAHKIIEECMLCANVASANLVISQKLKSLFRVHEPPGVDKVEKFRAFLADIGMNFTKAEIPHPKDYCEILESIRDRPDQHIIKTVLLRTLSQARYTPDNAGHFGLAYKAYTHFTSPIRRYPDLVLHRAIKASLKNKQLSYDEEEMQSMGEHCSATERRADGATRDVIEWLKCEYMMDKVGAEFDGVVSGVTNFGLFVELKDIYVEGLIHITAMDNDYFYFDAVRHMLQGERTKVKYCLGDTLKVKVEKVDLDERHIDFSLVVEK